MSDPLTPWVFRAPITKHRAIFVAPRRWWHPAILWLRGYRRRHFYWWSKVYDPLPAPPSKP